jgi:uncharacterized protein YjbI with pentapeptide repeats
MVILNKLLAGRGDARSILGLAKNGAVKWADSAELARFEVVNGIEFRGFIVSDAKVGVNFVECRFGTCSFRDLETDGHLWGAGDRWVECVFERCKMHRMIAPVNSFHNCRFEGVDIENFRPHQTVFEGCSFLGGSIEGIKAHMISNKQVENIDSWGCGGQLLFRNCRFERTIFRRCYFEGVVFQQCSYEQTAASECSFEGVVSDTKWWAAQTIDPFNMFLTEALDLVRIKCGKDSAAYREFETYVIEYSSGRTSDKNFSGSLYNKRVPYEETQRVIKDLRKLVASFPF